MCIITCFFTGKTAIAEGIAQRMVAGDVPDTLKPPCRLIGGFRGTVIAAFLLEPKVVGREAGKGVSIHHFLKE